MPERKREGGPTRVGPSSIPTDVATKVAAEREAQGLPPTVTDPIALARIAALLANAADGEE